MNKILELEDIKKGFIQGDESFEVLKGIDLKFVSGKWYTIYGESGSGKTTLLNIMGGLAKPEQGKVVYNGQDVYQMSDTQLSRWRNLKVGFVFQLFHLIAELDVKKNIFLPAEINNFNLNRQWFEEIIEILRIKNLLKRTPATLSGGEQQRVAMARAVINKPKIILADEPTGNLDSENSKMVIRLLKQLKEKTDALVILATHERGLGDTGDFTLCLKDGLIRKGE